MVCARFAPLKALGKRCLGESIFVKCSPILQTKSFRRIGRRLLFDFLCPIIRLLNDLKFDSRIGIADLIQLNLDEEKADILICVIV